MTTLTPTPHRRAVPLPDRWTALGAGVALVCVLVGTYVRTPWKSGSTEWDVDVGGTGGWGGLLLLAVLGVVAIVVFWAGLPSVLAGGAAGLAVSTRRRLGRLPGPAAAALVLAVLTVAGALYLAVTG